MRVICGKQPAADMFQVRMFEHGLHQPLAQTMSAIIFVDEDITKISEDAKISDDTRHAYLAPVFVDTKDQRVGKRFIRALTRTCLGPIGMGKKIIYGVHIHSQRIIADGELITVGFDYLRHAASLSHHGIIAGGHMSLRGGRSSRQSNLLVTGDCFRRKCIALAMTNNSMEKNVQTYSMEYFYS